MTTKFQVGQLAPWRSQINWDGKLYGERVKAIDDAVDRINEKQHKGKGFVQRIRGQDWSAKLSLQDIDDKMAIRIANSDLGLYVVTKSLKSNFKVFVRKVEVEVDPVMKTPGSKGIDILLDFVLEECKDLDPVLFGICNRRNIDGFDMPSQHCPWENLNDDQGPGSRAADIGTNPMSIDRGNEMARRLWNNKDTKNVIGKSIWAGRVRRDDSGGDWIPVPGIGHFDHLHIEPKNPAPSLWSLVRASCP